MTDPTPADQIDAAGRVALSRELFKLRDALHVLSLDVNDYKAEMDFETGGQAHAEALVDLQRILGAREQVKFLTLRPRNKGRAAMLFRASGFLPDPMISSVQPVGVAKCSPSSLPMNTSIQMAEAFRGS